ncbi:MAG TPA: KTSC domain-containing protein [Ramlibacter sp.]|nr:KTSC domain-containing protein [Ramlibacter sp.]
MPTQTFSNGRLRKATYDPATRQLDLHFDNRTVLAYGHVPLEVWRRLCSAPNPATYWEDRIAEEYPRRTPSEAPPADGGGKTLKDLFGGDPE